MRKLLTAISTAALFTVVGSMPQRAEAMQVGDPSGIRGAAEELNLTDNVQYYYGGRRYCWYDDGWNGPGWYWCGRYLSPGIGWGGGYGYRGWGGRGVGRIGGVGRVGGVGRGGGVGRVGGGRGGGVGRVGGGGVGRVGGGGGRIGGGGGGGGRIGGGGGGGG